MSHHEPPDNQGEPGFESEQDALASEASERFFKETLARFVEPELLRRVENEDWDDSEGVYRFQVLFKDEGPEIRLNQEVGGEATVQVTEAGKSLQKGDDVLLEHIAGVSEYRPDPEDAGFPHVSAFAHSGGWSLAFHFNRQHPDRSPLFDKGAEFVYLARYGLEAGKTTAFLENAFHAVELLAKAELLSNEVTSKEAAGTKKHGGVSSLYNKWGKLGNTEQRFVKLLNRLSQLRPKSTYSPEDTDPDADELQAMLDTLEAMEAHVASQVGGTQTGQPDRFTVYATRPIRAGQLVSPEDYSLTPPPKEGV